MPVKRLKLKIDSGFNFFDYFVLAGAVVNFLVILYLIGYWLIDG